ncbi:hypothetical protein PAAG_06497 [Paracoccidioides lutzii Pb01]|uniref:Uncharacterized protein n=1 Tax=Paracoccidioides lutzii (strain ATCC MYA-826 / Pb01) TaxID=502779 RepID=C1H6V6_PARBA|nr:hypothetical protein PAAG_06497 [Paracoccidioides lutzii Pb01]EEH35450.2 hypothetical protein PAAG_06497 [Paracoccidioides lutzii Pb01]
MAQETTRATFSRVGRETQCIEDEAEEGEGWWDGGPEHKRVGIRKRVWKLQQEELEANEDDDVVFAK